MMNLLFVIGAVLISSVRADECSNYKVLRGGDRAQGNTLQSNTKCDKENLVRGWYRFKEAAGDRMPDKCVFKNRCGSHATGWLRGYHPTVAEGVVTRRVCYHWRNNCCNWSNDIRVRNCGGYFVYYLQDTPACTLRYCGNAGADGNVCGKVVNNALKSPGYPKDYPSNLDCAYTVPIPQGKAMNITFEDFILSSDGKGSGLCKFDFLKITNDKNQTFGTYCGHESGRSVLATGNYVVITFHSSLSQGVGRRYKLYFDAIRPLPSVAPGNFSLWSSSPRSLVISWDAIPVEQQHGKLLGYYVYYKIEGSRVEHIKSVGPNQLTYKLTGLQYANYSVRIAGYTAAGIGKSTGSLIQRPMEGVQPLRDDDECQSDLDKCHEKAQCINTPGSYKCICLGGYFGNGTHCQDFDECQASYPYVCHEKAKCTNTPGSYNCTCLDGYYGDGIICQAPPSIYYVGPPTEAGTEENVTLTCHANGLPEPLFTWITPDGHAVNSTASVNESENLDDDGKYRRGKILQKDGSLLIYNTRVQDQGIYKCVAINVVGKDESSVNVTVREDLVGVDAAITIVEVFDRELENKFSARYQKMEKEVKRELTILFQDIEGFQRIEILKFTNGSIKIHFRVVVVKPKDKEPLAIEKKVSKTLRSVKDGEIGNLKVKSIEITERPPPPVDVQSADVKQTEAVIRWSHPEDYDVYAISSYSLQVREFGTEKWTQFTTTRGVNHKLTNLDPDTVYFVRLKSENKYGKGKPSENGELRTEKVRNGLALPLAIVSVLFVVVLAIVTGFGYRRWKKRGQRSGYTPPDEEIPMKPVTADTNPNTSTLQLPASFCWREIPRDRLTLGKVLGVGAFGMVVKGELAEDDGHITPCAVKKLKHAATESDLRDLLNELEMMASVSHHPNLVNLIGACSTGGQLMIVVEFPEHGNLQRHLRDNRKQNYEDMNEYSLEISSAERLRIACDVSDGMKHLAKMKWVHRDLAARNVLLGEGMVAKVADFGMTRDIYTNNVYEKKSGGKVPVKCLAVESFEQGLYTTQSDVWSFGVLLWEIETGGCAPYAGMSIRELLSQLKAGYRLEKPRYCSVGLYTVMLRCWNANPKTRPTFEELSDELRQLYTEVTEYLVPEECSQEYLVPEEYTQEPGYDYAKIENKSQTTPDDASVTAENKGAFLAMSSTSPLLADCTNQNGALKA